MTSRIRIADLAALDDGPVVVGGWIETVRDQKKVQFLVLRDESGAVQLVRPRPAEDDAIATAISEMAIGSFVLVAGGLKHDERVKLGGIEVRIE
ncbi:MAG TPA: OB-fold nucleic acid binding domain-containing protein, partial [Gaiellales bacterium]|nr:OB-fold nucleic acid binding domain-containing protein [Gaiellales bacterium]